MRLTEDGVNDAETCGRGIRLYFVSYVHVLVLEVDILFICLFSISNVSAGDVFQGSKG